MEWGSKLAKRGFSRLFTADLVDAWRANFGADPVTLEELFNNGDTCYVLLRAAGVTEPMFGRSRSELRRVNLWLDYFSRHPLPTHDGRDDSILTSRGEAWALLPYDGERSRDAVGRFVRVADPL